MTLWLVVAVAALGAAAWWDRRSQAAAASAARLLFYAALAGLIWFTVGPQAFSGSETGLLGLFIFGLGALALGDALKQWGGPLETVALVSTPMMALCFALGLDVLRPDEYALVPASLMRIGIFLLAWQAHRLLVRNAEREGSIRLVILGHIVALAVLVYAGVYKMMDRNWAMPWAYMACGGALLAAASQLWRGWRVVFGQDAVPVWAQRLAFGAATLLIVVAAVFVYREFL